MDFVRALLSIFSKKKKDEEKAEGAEGEAKVEVAEGEKN